MFALVVIGPPGSGKTTVLTALENALADDGIRHAAIEVEALSWAHPPLPDEQSLRHLAELRRLYADAGYDLVLCGATVTSSSYLDRLLTALAPDQQLVVRLEADPSTLRQRIGEREPPSWSGLPRLLAAAGEIAVTSRQLGRVDLTCSTEDRTPLELAEEIRATCPDVLKAAGRA